MLFAMLTKDLRYKVYISFPLYFTSMLAMSAAYRSCDTNSWVMLYCIEWMTVIITAMLSNYFSFIGFFAITALTSTLTALALLTKWSFFITDSSSLSFETASLAKLSYSSVNISLYIDTIGYSFGLLTALIGSAVYFYAFSYMRFEKNILNFLIYLQIFKLSMMLLVWANSWFTLILGWELIGASSFLLINFWTSKITTLKSAFKALSFNKLSDASLISAACIALWFGASTIQSTAQFGAVLAEKNIAFGYLIISANDIFLICLSIAAFCKSAQLGFHFWLPDSMEAPVPASALIHSATLVSAGIYLILRFNFCFIYSPIIMQVFQFVAAATAFYGAIIAAFQTDVKKILAYSTISHCGMLMFSITLMKPEITLFYLFAHGFFKSLNFLCVGNFIQYANNYQDISRMGGFNTNYKIETFFLFITTFNLSSAPLFLAFFSKHWLLNTAPYYSFSSSIACTLIFAAAYCGFFYSAKLYSETILAKKKAHYTAYNTRAINPNSIKIVKRGNFLAFFGIVLLCIYTVVVLSLFFLHLNNLNIWVGDNWSGVPASMPGFFENTLLLGFSQVLVILAYSYLAFKRARGRIAPIIFFLILLALFLSI